MRLMQRNKQPVWFCLLEGQEEVEGLPGQYRPVYGQPALLTASVSRPSGFADTEAPGIRADYSKTVITDDLDCPISESSVLFLDREPVFDGQGNPLFDYTVRRVSRTFNFISIVARRVRQTE